MNVCILTENELARTHGTGAQLLLTYSENTVTFHHFYWYVYHGALSESVHSYILADRKHRIPKTGRLLRWMRRVTKSAWWDDENVNAAKLRTLIRRKSLKCDVAHVVVMQEGGARRARSVLDTLAVPYVVHLMDILHDRLDERSTPEFCKLIRGAARSIALTPTIKCEMDRISGRDAELVGIGQPITSCVAAAPCLGGPIEIVLTGRPYSAGCELLAAAMPDIRQSHPNVQLVYYGAAYDELPLALRSWVRDGGYLNQESDYRRALANSHIAFLSGPSTDDHFARFSFPSRVTDLLMAGLPVVAVLAASSATRLILDPVMPQAVRVVQSSSELTNAIDVWASSTQAWSSASSMARSFASEHFAIERTRKQIFAALRAVANVNGSAECAHASIGGKISCSSLL